MLGVTYLYELCNILVRLKDRNEWLSDTWEQSRISTGHWSSWDPYLTTTPSKGGDTNIVTTSKDSWPLHHKTHSTNANTHRHRPTRCGIWHARSRGFVLALMTGEHRHFIRRSCALYLLPFQFSTLSVLFYGLHWFAECYTFINNDS